MPKQATVASLKKKKSKSGKSYELHIVAAGPESWWYVTDPYSKKTMFQSADYFSSGPNAERSAMRSLQKIIDGGITVVRD
ncbi:hypothetical protein Lumi_060 [Xylophilus phage Lumi]|nr:hypothetical protein Lumi_060 [Xylophilus phage Lumi]